jgi:diguanylate cyclase (GGDEF)-like protein
LPIDRSADQAAALDLIGTLAGLTSEEQIVQQTLDAVKRLCSPVQVVFAAVENDTVRQVWSDPADDDAGQNAMPAALVWEEAAEALEVAGGFRVRIVHRAQTLGVLHVAGFAFPEHKQDYLRTTLVIAKVCGLALSNARVYHALGETLGELETEIDKTKVVERHLRHLSTHDFLTGLYNRTFFEAELARLGRSRQFPITIMIADVNDLKPVNDRYGHPAGDRLLQDVAQILQSVFRADEIVARIGGDEFAVILPNTDSWPVPRIEHRVRRAIAAYVAGEGFTLSLALGSATADVGESLAEIFKLADQRMYEDKKAIKRRL